jgi:inorganic pyrophosphatase
MLECRLLGVIEAHQKNKGKPWIRNDRLIAVARHARAHNTVNTLRELPRPILHDIQAFFVDYNRLDDKKFHPLGVRGPRRAEKLVKKGIAVFKKQRRDAQK